MSPLPSPALARGSIEVGGVTVEYRSLSRVEALKLASFGRDEDGAEDYMLACALDIPVTEAHAWREAVDLATSQPLIEAIVEVSGLNPKASGENGSPPRSDMSVTSSSPS
jgi:hypothetical protein